MSQTIGERLRELRGTMSRAKFAQRIGVSAGTFVRYESGERSPPFEFLQKVCKEFAVSFDWLTEGHVPEGRMVEPFGTSRGVSVPLMHPRLAPDSGAAGVFTLDPLIVAHLAYSTDVLRAAIVRGDAMEPSLHDGDVVVFADDVAARDAVCVVAVRGVVQVKRVQMTLSGGVRLIPENPRYEPLEVEAGAPDVAVLGPVVWRGVKGS